MKLRLDPWAAEYNTAYFAEDAPLTIPERIDISVETEVWQAIRPTGANTPWDKLLFIDGGRRIEARVLLELHREQVAFGALGTFAVGAVDCCSRHSRQAEILETVIERICALGGGHTMSAFEIETKPSSLGLLKYKISETKERDAEAVVRHLQEVMLRAEQLLASRLVQQHPNALIICDGPRPLIRDEQNIIGYVKTIHDPRLSREQLALVRGLEEGERSPVYLVHAKDAAHDYFEWFLRLRDPRPWLYSLAGMVRLQAYAGERPEENLQEVINLANWTCLSLTKFASRQHQDPRAPQQLLPTRALESELRRRMGDAGIIRRRITEYLSQF
ncbi:MAG: hypothetical protein ACRCYY_11270 [Trueperaceae bacterium]